MCRPLCCFLYALLRFCSHQSSSLFLFFLFFFNAPATTEIYTLSLHDALPISNLRLAPYCVRRFLSRYRIPAGIRYRERKRRSEEHTSELQSRVDLVCRLLLEKKKKKKKNATSRKKNMETANK